MKKMVIINRLPTGIYGWVTLNFESWEVMAEFFSSMVNDFKFLPAMLLAFMVNSEAKRWLDMLACTFRVQGRIHDLGLFLAGAFEESTTESVRALFEFYRLLNAAHYALYFTRDPRVGNNPDEFCSDLEVVGLLTESEQRTLAMGHPRMRDLLLTWIGVTFQQHVRAGRISRELTTKFLDELSTLRGDMAALVDAYDKYPSNVHSGILKFSINMLMLLFLIKYGAKYADVYHCWNIGVPFTCALIFTGYKGLTHMIRTLALTPFAAEGDPINIDVLLCSTERYLFTVFRGSEDGPLGRPSLRRTL